MIHPEYLRPGAILDLPELAAHIPGDSPRFEVLGVFHGGMGLGAHLKHVETGVHYALKGVRPDLVGGKAIMDRFGEELRVWLSASTCSLVAEALAVVRVNEHPCVLATWMPHGDLAKALPRFAPQQKFETAVRILRGLRWAYESLGIIHRDMKPPNVLLDEADLAYVSDWGLARPVGRAFGAVSASLSLGAFQRTDHTEAGSFIGTVTYAAPEQLIGSSKIDHRADIYALGCMLFEFEVGHPPFLGNSVHEIAQQHLNAPPPNFGGWFRKTTLGLEDVVARCLQKDPAARYATYTELDAALVRIAKRRGFTLNRCEVSSRYTRSVIGKGVERQGGVLATTGAKGRDGYGVVDFEQVAPFFEEAENLMALLRFNEAEALLRPHFVPEFLGGIPGWCFVHGVAINYGLCLVNMEGRLEEGLEIFRVLDRLSEKPVEFFVNYSLGLLRRRDWVGVCSVCERGLRRFPDDLDLIGNHTIGLKARGLLESALESARKRIHLRKDVHSIDEGVLVLGALRDRDRNRNLPVAIAIAKEQGFLINDGLMLNQQYWPLRFAQIALFRFAHQPDVAMDLCVAALEAKDTPPKKARETVFMELLEVLADAGQIDEALRRISREKGAVTHPELRERLEAFQMRLIAKHRMIGKDAPDGARFLVREVVDYFLPNGCVSGKDPVITAEVLEWMSRGDEARDVLSSHLRMSPDDWEGLKAMALFFQRANLNDDAVAWATRLTETAPWRAESYDCLEYVAKKAGLVDVAREAQRRGNEVFEREKSLFDELRTALEAS